MMLEVPWESARVAKKPWLKHHAHFRLPICVQGVLLPSIAHAYHVSLSTQIQFSDLWPDFGMCLQDFWDFW